MLAAVEVLAQVDGLPGRCRQLDENRAARHAFGLWKGYRLIFEPANDPLPMTGDGLLDRGRVTEIRILEIEESLGD
jgi:proteic killer suppression protein